MSLVASTFLDLVETYYVEPIHCRFGYVQVLIITIRIIQVEHWI